MRLLWGRERGGLTPQQARFVEEYLVDLNATQAAKRAGYKHPATQGLRLLGNVRVSSAVSAAQGERSERTKVTQDRVLTELAKIGFGDIRNAVRWGRSPVDEESTNADPNGLNIYPLELVLSDEISDDTATCVAQVSLTQAVVKIKMHDKFSALDKIGRHLGMFEDKTEL